MNLILFDKHQQAANGFYILSERQYTHIRRVIKAEVGDSLRVGVLNGLIGEGIFQGENEQGQGVVDIKSLTVSPPKSLPLTLVLALPRPNMLKRTLLNISTMGVKKLVLINSARVEKSYWQSPVLVEENIHAILLEGLEQARDTQLPDVELITRFRPYVEDVLPHYMENKIGLLAHPYQSQSCPINMKEEVVLAIGPEGGWNQFEVEKWQTIGFNPVSLGERILKVETAVPVLLSRLFPL
ncbi:16S rRNA (uracil(1498)-N(3))-methyltransferase [Marinomonas agarivorans]|nr:16S rRNA (uracil(1498)-N(3))-methyltransferase [Marinomonas agarivorans]